MSSAINPPVTSDIDTPSMPCTAAYDAAVGREFAQLVLLPILDPGPFERAPPGQHQFVGTQATVNVIAPGARVARQERRFECEQVRAIVARRAEVEFALQQAVG